MNKDGPIPEHRPELGPCWIWTGYCSKKGYGAMPVDGRARGTHRLAYELLVGPIPDGLQIDHLCRVPACCNPAHLEAVTSRENTVRGVSHNGLKTHCKHGHPFDAANTYVTRRGKRWCRACGKERKASKRTQIKETA